MSVASSVAFGRANVSNFAAEKSGLIGLGRAAGLEGVAHSISVDSILPAADTRAARAGLEAARELEIRDWSIEHFAPAKVAQAVITSLVRSCVAKNFHAAMNLDDATVLLDNHSEKNTHIPFVPSPF